MDRFIYTIVISPGSFQVSRPARSARERLTDGPEVVINQGIAKNINQSLALCLHTIIKDKNGTQS